MEQKEKSFRNLKNRKFTLYALILAVLAFAITIPLNLLASRLDIQWDMTPTKIYNLTDTTKDYLSSLDKQVDFYFLLDMDLLSTDMNSMELYHTLEQYASYDCINFVSFDPDDEPTLTKKLMDLGYTLSEGDMVISCDGRSKHIEASSMYSTQYSTDDSGNMIADSAFFNGENIITGAIEAVASGRDTKVFFLTGHGERQIDTDYTKLKMNLSNRNYDLQELDLAAEEAVPEGTAFVILAAPQTDISKDELRKLNAYLDNGGNVCFWMSPNASETQYKNIESIMNSFGIAMDYDRVKETDSSIHVSDDPYTFRCTVVASEDEVDLTYEIIENYLNQGYSAYMSNTRSFYQTYSADETSLKVGSLLQTMTSTDDMGQDVSTAVGEAYGGKNSKNVKEGQILDLAMYSTSTMRNNAKIMVMGNADFIDDANLQEDYMIVPVSLMLSTFSWMYDSKLDLDMGIENKEQTYDSFFLNSEQAANTASIVFICVPFAVGLIGLGVWLKRRYS